jgi:hypothetical protein
MAASSNTATGSGQHPSSTSMPPTAAATVVDDESMSSATAFLIAVISLIIYLVFLRPTTNGNPATPSSEQQQQQDQPVPPGTQQQRPATGNANHRTRRMVGNNNNALRPSPNPLLTDRPSVGGRTTHLSEAAREILEQCKSKPPHFKASTSLSQIRIGGVNVLMDGLVAFSHTEAATAAASMTLTKSSPSPRANTLPATTPTTTEVTNGSTTDVAVDDDVSADEAAQMMARRLRQERAKILSRLFENVTSSSSPSGSGSIPSKEIRPPSKGGTLVVGLSYNQIVDGATVASMDIVTRVLYSLATYYTVMVMVQVPLKDASAGLSRDYLAAERLHQEVVTRLRTISSRGDDGSQYYLSESVLPSHRIMLSSSVTGRVALVRQLASVELVVDYDPEIRTQLERFGYRVALVENEKDWTKTFSSVVVPATSGSNVVPPLASSPA